jgi:hypothetical protein
VLRQQQCSTNSTAMHVMQSFPLAAAAQNSMQVASQHLFHSMAGCTCFYSLHVRMYQCDARTSGAGPFSQAPVSFLQAAKSSCNLLVAICCPAARPSSPSININNLESPAAHLCLQHTWHSQLLRLCTLAYVADCLQTTSNPISRSASGHLH